MVLVDVVFVAATGKYMYSIESRVKGVLILESDPVFDTKYEAYRAAFAKLQSQFCS